MDDQTKTQNDDTTDTNVNRIEEPEDQDITNNREKPEADEVQVKEKSDDHHLDKSESKEKLEEKPEPEKGTEPEEKPAKPILEDPRITDRDKSIKQIFGESRDDGFYPMQKKDSGKIEIQQYDIPIKKVKSEESDSKHAEHQKNKDSSPKPDRIDTNRALAATVITTVLVLALGLGGGFFGFKYGPVLLKNVAVSADTFNILKTSAPTQPANTTEISNPVAPANPVPSQSDNQTLTLYSNSRYNYSVKFPSNWSSQNTEDPQADTIQLSSVKIDASTPTNQTGLIVEISFKSANNELLKDWITKDNKTAGYGTPKLTAVKIDGKDAYQQTVSASANEKMINSYVFQADKVMIISYNASDTDFTSGTKIYQSIIDSIKLL
jgi:hypothetical protein